jgi:hypothetical protein
MENQIPDKATESRSSSRAGHSVEKMRGQPFVRRSEI